MIARDTPIKEAICAEGAITEGAVVEGILAMVMGVYPIVEGGEVPKDAVELCI